MDEWDGQVGWNGMDDWVDGWSSTLYLPNSTISGS